MELAEKMEEFIKELPHGSGIDYDWEWSESRKYWKFANAWHYLNEHGYYDGVLPFTLLIPKDDVMNYKIVFHVNGAGRYRVNKGCIKEYLLDHLYWAIYDNEDHLKSH